MSDKVTESRFNYKLKYRDCAADGIESSFFVASIVPDFTISPANSITDEAFNSRLP
jgi:hypothetical protein